MAPGWISHLSLHPEPDGAGCPMSFTGAARREAIAATRLPGGATPKLGVRVRLRAGGGGFGAEGAFSRA